MRDEKEELEVSNHYLAEYNAGYRRRQSDALAELKRLEVVNLDLRRELHECLDDKEKEDGEKGGETNGKSKTGDSQTD